MIRIPMVKGTKKFLLLSDLLPVTMERMSVSTEGQCANACFAITAMQCLLCTSFVSEAGRNGNAAINK